MKRLLIWMIRTYQSLLSPDHSWWARAMNKPPYCKHIPSCSDYGIQSLERYGAIRGSWLAFRRILRCNPWMPGGYDPVPDEQCKKMCSIDTKKVPIEP